MYVKVNVELKIVDYIEVYNCAPSTSALQPCGVVWSLKKLDIRRACIHMCNNNMR